MNDFILDSGIVVSACSSTDNSDAVATMLQKLRDTEKNIWIYTAQITEILWQVENELEAEGENDCAGKARSRLKAFTRNCSWLAALAEDGKGLDDSDPIGAGLCMAADRLGKTTIVITNCPLRLERGFPFVDVESVCNTVVMDTPVAFIDLSSQQNRIRPNLERNLHRVLHHGRYVMGPEIERLELLLANYVGVDHCISVSSGTDALLIAMMSLGIGPGDEVVTSPFTFFAVAETIKLLGARPVFVDIDPQSYTLDPAGLEAAVTDQTRAVLPVSLYGQCGDMDQINEIAAAYQLPVIEDGAQSFGATYKERRSCALSEIGCTSFFPAKPFGAYGDAGACFTNDPLLADRMREIRDHGQSGRYKHVRIGINGRMDTLQAGVLLSKFEILDDELAGRVKVAERYARLLSEFEAVAKLKLPMLEHYNVSSWAQYTIEVHQRDRVRRKLIGKGIPTAVHYPVPVYAQPGLAQTRTDCPNTDKAVQRVLSLPMHSYLDPKTQEAITHSLVQAIDL